MCNLLSTGEASCLQIAVQCCCLTLRNAEKVQRLDEVRQLSTKTKADQIGKTQTRPVVSEERTLVNVSTSSDVW